MATKPATKPQASKNAKARIVEEEEEEVEGAEFSDEGEGEGVIIDLDGDYGSTDFEVLPRGIYDCQVAECTYGLSQNSGNPMWTLKLQVESGDHEGSILFTHMVWKGKGLPRSVSTVKKCFPQLESPLNPQEVADEGILEGARVRARVDIRPYQGEKRNNVRALLPAADEE